MKQPLSRWISVGLLTVLVTAGAVGAGAQGFRPDPVFDVSLAADQAPAIAGEPLRLAVVIDIDDGWHINTDNPGDEFMVPTTVQWQLPEGWPQPTMDFPEGEEVAFEFSENPLRVWAIRTILVGNVVVPEDATGQVTLGVTVNAQACNDTQCLPPLDVAGTTMLEVAAPGSDFEASNESLFAAVPPEKDETAGGEGTESGGMGDKSLPLFLVGVFLAGLALNLTPCVFPLIPITVGFFTQQSKGRTGGTFWMALAYVLGIAATYSALGVAAALGGGLFGSYLQNPWVVGLIVVVLLALATSMFGLWEFKTPNWAHKAAGSRGGVVGALLMGLVMGFVAAPCIGPFVLGLLTYVGQKGDPVFGFIAFFTLALGLGLPYLLLGTFTGAVSRLPMSGPWMVGVRRIFGVILVAMAAYFAAPLLAWGDWLLAGTLVVGGLYLLVIDRTCAEISSVDRVVRLVTTAMIVVGLWLAPFGHRDQGSELAWQPYDASRVHQEISDGQPVIVDFFADWCLPCKELDAKTFSDPEVAAVLEDFARFKVDQTRNDEAAQRVAEAFAVRGVPTVIVYARGREAFRITGFERPERFLERLRAALP